MISSEPQQAADSWIRKLLVNDAKARAYWDAVHRLHKMQASMNGASRWISMPANHISLVTARETARQIATRIIAMLG